MNSYECVRESDGSFLVKKLGNSGTYIPLEVTPPGISNVGQTNQPVSINQPKVSKVFVEISNVKQLKPHNLTGAKVISCVVGNNQAEKTTWSNSIRTLYKQIADGTKIIKNSILPIKTVRKVDEGFTFIKDLGISVCVKKTRKNLVKEIIKQAKDNNLTVRMEIELDIGAVLVVNIAKAQ